MIPKPSEMSIPCITDADMIVDQYRYLLLFRSSRLIGHVGQNFSGGVSDDRTRPDLIAVQPPHGDRSLSHTPFPCRTNFLHVLAKLAGTPNLPRCDAAAASPPAPQANCIAHDIQPA